MEWAHSSCQRSEGTPAHTCCACDTEQGSCGVPAQGVEAAASEERDTARKQQLPVSGEGERVSVSVCPTQGDAKREPGTVCPGELQEEEAKEEAHGRASRARQSRMSTFLRTIIVACTWIAFPGQLLHSSFPLSRSHAHTLSLFHGVLLSRFILLMLESTVFFVSWTTTITAARSGGSRGHTSAPQTHMHTQALSLSLSLSLSLHDPQSIH